MNEQDRRQQLAPRSFPDPLCYRRPSAASYVTAASVPSTNAAPMAMLDGEGKVDHGAVAVVLAVTGCCIVAFRVPRDGGC